MFYFESIRIQAETLNTPYALTLKLEQSKAYFLSSQNNDWLNKLFLFIKDKTGYQYGNWLVDNYDLIHASNQQFNNFVYQNFSFCDESLIFNDQLSVAKMLQIYAKFFQKNKTFVRKMLCVVSFPNDLTHTKIKNLDYFNFLKLMLCLSCFKQSKYLICNFINMNKLNSEQISDIQSYLNQIVQDYNKTVICFVNMQFNIANKICLDQKEYLFSNKTITISLNKYQDAGYKLWKNKLSIFTNMFWLINWEWIVMFLVNLVLITLTVWMLTLPKVNAPNSPTILEIINFSKNHSVLWKIISYFLYICTFANMVLWWMLMSKKRKKYLAFLSNVHVGTINKAVVWPTIYFTCTIISMIIAFFIVDIHFVISQASTGYLWFVLPLFLYIIYIVVLILGLALQINQTIKPNTFKQTFIDIISK